MRWITLTKLVKIESGYGDSVVRRLSADLKERYPKMGVSPRNLWDMKKFYERFCHSNIKVRQAVALLPWGHILRLLQKVGDDDAAMLFYAKETRSKGWNRDLLLNAIKLKSKRCSLEIRRLWQTYPHLLEIRQIYSTILSFCLRTWQQRIQRYSYDEEGV